MVVQTGNREIIHKLLRWDLRMYNTPLTQIAPLGLKEVNKI